MVAQSLAEAPNGDLWVGTRFGISRIPGAAVNQFGPLPSTRCHLGTGGGDSVACLRMTRDGVLWAGIGQGLYRKTLSVAGHGRPYILKEDHS